LVTPYTRATFAVADGKLTVNGIAVLGVAVVHSHQAITVRTPVVPEPTTASTLVDQALKLVTGLNETVPAAGFIVRTITARSPTAHEYTGAVTVMLVLAVLLVLVPNSWIIGYSEILVTQASPVDVEAAEPSISSTRLTIPALAETDAEEPDSTATVLTEPLADETVLELPATVNRVPIVPLVLDAVTEVPVTTPSNPIAPFVDDTAGAEPEIIIVWFSVPLAEDTAAEDPATGYVTADGPCSTITQSGLPAELLPLVVYVDPGVSTVVASE